jgi:hypothetical protein
MTKAVCGESTTWTKQGINAVADLERTVRIIFEAIDSMTDPLTDMSSALSEFGGSAVDVSEDANDLSDSITDIPAEADIYLTVSGDAQENIDAVNEDIGTLPEDVSMDISLAGTDEFSNIFDDLSTSIDETGSSIDQFFQDNPAQLSQLEADQWEQAINDDMEKKKADFDLQKDLIDQQLELLEAKERALDSGEGLIKIDSTGVEPALLAFVFEILRLLQVEMNKDGNKFLLNI